MKNKRHILSSIILPVAAVALILSATPDASAAYWNRNRNHSEKSDIDGDGIPNSVDSDVDNDGIPNGSDDNVDGGIAKSGPFRGRFVGDHKRNDDPSEKDIDGDGLNDDSLAEKDIDGDGLDDSADTEEDIDGDRRKDDAKRERDIDGDGRGDDSRGEKDIDGDDVLDSDDDDIDGDGRRNDDVGEDDRDGDGRGNDDTAEHDSDGDDVNDDVDDDHGAGHGADDGPGHDVGDDHGDDGPDHDIGDDHGGVGEVEVSGALARTAAAPAGSNAKAVLSIGGASVELEIEVEDVPAGDYDVAVGGVIRGVLHALPVSSGTKGRLKFDPTPDKAGELLLDFPAAGQSVEVSQGGVILFVGTSPTAP